MVFERVLKFCSFVFKAELEEEEGKLLSEGKTLTLRHSKRERERERERDDPLFGE